MKINIIKRKSTLMRDFDKKEWKFHDIDHYGKDVTWDTEMYYLKAMDNNNIVGIMELKVEGGIGNIKTLLIAHNRLRQGIGKALIQRTEEIAKKQNVHKLILHTGKKWESISFYESVGFKVTGELPNHYWHIDFVEMSKFLGS